MKNEVNMNESVTKKEFKKAIRNINIMIFGLAAAFLYMYFCK